jgi:hypothetical protein
VAEGIEHPLAQLSEGVGKRLKRVDPWTNKNIFAVPLKSLKLKLKSKKQKRF